MQSQGHKAAGSSDTYEKMERMYRPQKLIYDITRRYYLLGRDRTLKEIDAPPGARIYDVGCGTGRNLARLCELYPQAELVGIEPAQAMLELASSRIEKIPGSKVQLKKAIADDIPSIARATGAPDHILFSYSLSMIDNPVNAIEAALAALPAGGQLHVADFGPMDRMPGIMRSALNAWLKKFHVFYKPEVSAYLTKLKEKNTGTLSCNRPFGGYCEILHFTKVASA